jgi:hypothetical protein
VNGPGMSVNAEEPAMMFYWCIFHVDGYPLYMDFDAKNINYRSFATKSSGLWFFIVYILESLHITIL